MNVEDLYRLLRTGHVQAQGIVDTISDPMLVLDESLRVQMASRSFVETFNVDRDETIGQLVYELGDGQWNIPEFRLLLSQVIPRSAAIINYEVKADFPDIGPRTMLLTARTVFHPTTKSHSLLLVFVDVTDDVNRDTAKDMLFGELRHRMKNLLAVTQSLARHTATKGRTAEQYRDDFLGRFEALVEAQELAFAEQQDASLAVLIQRILAPYANDPEAVVIKPGEDVELGPPATMSLGMVLHEFATNAAKYGALSAPGGKLRVSWAVESKTTFRLKWVESGGPAVAAPTTTGYGSKLIQFTTTYSLGGRVEQQYAPDGLRVEIVIPLGTASHEG